MSRDTVHVNSVEGFNSRARRTIAGVFHHIRPQHADLYFHEIGFRWSQRVITGSAVRKTRHGREIMRTLWSRVPPALQLLSVFRAATGRQMRRKAALFGGPSTRCPQAALIEPVKRLRYDFKDGTPEPEAPAIAATSSPTCVAGRF